MILEGSDRAAFHREFNPRFWWAFFKAKIPAH